MLKDIDSSLPARIALVHEWFTPRSRGGSEIVAKSIDNVLLELNRKADLFALVDGESKREDSWLFGRSLETSFIQNFPFGSTSVQKYLPLLPFAIEQINLDSYPLVISSSHLVAKGVLTSPDQLHVSYIHTPVRYAWDQMNIYMKHSKFLIPGLDSFVRWQLHNLRQWDQLSSSRVDHFVANSNFTARRIRKYWGKKAEVIHPPVEVDRFSCNCQRDEYYLCLSRLVPNKRVDLVVRAFNKMGLPLIVVGDGVERKKLERIAGPNVSILGFQNFKEVKSLMERCRAFVYAGIEDFGIAPVEAMAAGSPVIAFAKGGLLDTVRYKKDDYSLSTGLLFELQEVSSLIEAVLWFEEKKLWNSFSSQMINNWARRFSSERFNHRFNKLLLKLWKSHQKLL